MKAKRCKGHQWERLMPRPEELTGLTAEQRIDYSVDLFLNRGLQEMLFCPNCGSVGFWIKSARGGVRRLVYSEYFTEAAKKLGAKHGFELPTIK